MKRYIFFIGTLGNGGAERVASILASRMAEKGMNVEILTYYDKPVSYDINENVKISVVEKITGTGNKIKNLLEIRKYFKENAKVVISFLAPFNMMAIAANLGNGVPMIVADRNDPTKVPSNAVLRKSRDFLYRFADGIVVQTQKNKAYFSKAVQRKSVVIYNPISLKEYAGISLKLEKEKAIVTAGRLMPQKNQKMMIRAFKKVVEEYPDYQLIIYGEGPSRTELESLIAELELEKSVKLPGNTTKLYDCIKNAELFVLSSDYEGMPNALIEAMCMGLPVISTKVSGATDLIVDHENGLLVEVNDQSGFEEAMLELIEDSELKKELAKSAVQLNEELELSKIMDQWITFINKTITEKY